MSDETLTDEARLVADFNDLLIEEQGNVDELPFLSPDLYQSVSLEDREEIISMLREIYPKAEAAIRQYGRDHLMELFRQMQAEGRKSSE